MKQPILGSSRHSAFVFLFFFGTAGGFGAAALAQGASPPALPPGHPGSAARMQQQAPGPRIDINSASVAELKTLPGIGEAEAKKIVAGRPYLTKADLVTKNVLAEGIYVALKDRIVALQAGAPAGKK